jgi:Golgi nucleoside diphosphatase
MTKSFKENWRKLRQPLLVTMSGLFILAFVLNGFTKNIRRVFSANQEINQIKSEIERLDKKTSF